MNQYNSQEELLKKINIIPVSYQDEPKKVIESTIKSYELIYGQGMIPHKIYHYYLVETYKYCSIYKQGHGENEITIKL